MHFSTYYCHISITNNEDTRSKPFDIALVFSLITLNKLTHYWLNLDKNLMGTLAVKRLISRNAKVAKENIFFFKYTRFKIDHLKNRITYL